MDQNINTRESVLDHLTKQLQSASAPPFLFVGSGFSRRYLGLPSWQELLKEFSIRPYNYYETRENRNLPQVASLIAEDYFEKAWDDENKAEILAGKSFSHKSDVLKYFIAEYIREKYNFQDDENLHPVEIQKLESLKVDAIITTNWDTYLEDIFPDYTTYVGQEEIVMANPLGVGEIYKIHGCIKKPESLILTGEDYKNFEINYAYLASKLVTFLIEHPIIFLGYSMQDENISKILESVARCAGSNIQTKLQNNLILVQRCGKERVEGITSSSLRIQDYNIPFTIVTTDDFGVVYDAINQVKRKIPAKLLRILKNEIYELAHSVKPESKIYVADIEDIDEQNIEFVVGVGVKETHERGKQVQNSDVGYSLIPIKDICNDVICSEDSESNINDVNLLLKSTLPHYLQRSVYTPIFKYLRMLNISNHDDYLKLGYDLDKVYKRELSDFKLTLSEPYVKLATGRTVSDIIENNTPQKAAIIIVHMEPQEIDFKELCSFLKSFQEIAYNNQADFSSYRKLITFYDKIKFGWSIPSGYLN